MLPPCLVYRISPADSEETGRTPAGFFPLSLRGFGRPAFPLFGLHRQVDRISEAAEPNRQTKSHCDLPRHSCRLLPRYRVPGVRPDISHRFNNIMKLYRVHLVFRILGTVFYEDLHRGFPQRFFASPSVTDRAHRLFCDQRVFTGGVPRRSSRPLRAAEGRPPRAPRG